MNHDSLSFYFYLREVPVTVMDIPALQKTIRRGWMDTPARGNGHTGARDKHTDARNGQPAPIAPLTSSAS